MKLSYVGDYRWRRRETAAFLDIEAIALEPEGTYTARVEATLVNSAVRCTTTPCTLAETGTWSVYQVSGQTRMRLRPTTNKARVYVASIEDGELTLSRRGSSTVLSAE